MENDRPMDRLICGDVGFGKTEVAIRPAFKAVSDNKQVAVLVPTTVLAFQHYQTFCERLKDFPCKIDYISRARTAAQIKATFERAERGRGEYLDRHPPDRRQGCTFQGSGLAYHRRGAEVRGIRQGEASAAEGERGHLDHDGHPDPRTLQFSLMGARDLSSITTPPPNRYPVQTEVERFNPDIIREAINFEMSRNGQVFFINNRIQNIYEMETLSARSPRRTGSRGARADGTGEARKDHPRFREL